MVHGLPLFGRQERRGEPGDGWEYWPPLSAAVRANPQGRPVSDIALIVVRGLAGGALVVVFSLVSELFSPKAFAGLFSSGPSIAFASLAVTIGFETAAKAEAESVGLLLGGIAMVVSCVVASASIPRLKALWGAMASWVAWGLVAVGLYWGLFVGVR